MSADSAFLSALSIIQGEEENEKKDEDEEDEEKEQQEQQEEDEEASATALRSQRKDPLSSCRPTPSFLKGLSAPHSQEHSSEGPARARFAPLSGAKEYLVSPPNSEDSPTSKSLRTPAAGAGTRTGPRPVPRSSSSLRHVSSSRAGSSRGVSFHTVPEDSTADSQSGSMTDTGSAIKRKIDAEEKRRRETLLEEDFWATESGDELTRGEDTDVKLLYGLQEPNLWPASGQTNSSVSGANENEEEPGDRQLSLSRQSTASRHQSRRDSDAEASQTPRGSHAEFASSMSENASSIEGDKDKSADHDDSEYARQNDHTSAQLPSDGQALDEESSKPVKTAAIKQPRSLSEEPSAPRRAPWHHCGTSPSQFIYRSTEPPGYRSSRWGGLGSHISPQAPGIIYPASLNTPPDDMIAPPSPEMEPRQRLEWQTMLESVLASEVLRSETKRITSVDTPDLSRQELLYRRWLDIRANVRGRGHLKGAVEAEENRLRAGWPKLLQNVIQATKSCRHQAEQEYDASLAAAKNPNYGRTANPAVVLTFGKEKIEHVFQEVGDVLQQIDDAESQFPSSRKAIEIVAEWGDAKFQYKVGALYAWYNITSLLQLQLRILREWTGSDSLSIDVPFQVQAGNHHPNAGPLRAASSTELEGMTFVERILKQNSLKSTFEKRTLGSITKLVCKARDTIKAYHLEFARMKLPSFDTQLVELISFPMRLMEGAVRMRLDYAGKIKEPSLLIVDSLTDDLREALDVAIRTKRTYLSIMVPDPEHGWQLAPVIEGSYDQILREALQFFFRLISFKLKGSVFFKETEILDTEWQFLSQAVEVIEGGDIIVAKSITTIVNQLFTRIIGYFKSELAAPNTRRRSRRIENAGGFGTDRSSIGNDSVAPDSTIQSSRGPPMTGSLTRGFVHLTLPEKVKWIHAVFDNVRVRSRKLLGFARDIRNRLDNAAEYDLASLRPPPSDDEDASPTIENKGGAAPTAAPEGMDLNTFMQTLISADYFLVYTQTYEEKGIYIIAEPSLHDKPEIIQDLIGKCVRKISPHSGSYASGGANQYNVSSGLDEELPINVEESDIHTGANTGNPAVPTQTSPAVDEGEPFHYLLLLTPRDAFMWTGRVMPYKMEPVEVDLEERRLRLIADGPKDRLRLCKDHFYRVFASHSTTQSHLERIKDEAIGSEMLSGTAGSAPADFPLDVINEHMAHMSDVQAELSNINKGVYMLSTTIIRAVPNVRRSMRVNHSRSSSVKHSQKSREPAHGEDDAFTRNRSATESEELIQNCFSMAAEQGFRALPFIESARLRGFMTMSLARLAIDWVGFICDDCVPTDRKTFKWAVAALENAVQVTRNENIFHLSEEDFNLMRAKVASCVALLISHFDILGARSSVAKAKEEQDRLEREKAERSKAIDSNLQVESNEAVDRFDAAARLVQDLSSGGADAQPMLNRVDSGMQVTEKRWVQKMIEWDEARQIIEAEQRLIGRVLDDTRLEDQGLQFLASSSNRVHIRWQQGRFIGGGTFGTVYLAVNLDSGGLMAVKEIRFQDISSTPSLYKQIKDEMNVMEMLSHPNIVEYYGIEVHRDKVYIFEEYCQGGSLAQLLEHGRIEDEAVIQVYTLQMLDGLVYLHSRDVVHRDIKPDNILLDHMGVIKFVDFGAAKVLAKNSRTIQRSRRGGGTGGMINNNANVAGMLGPDGRPMGVVAVQSLQGTPMYMSPEVIKGETRGRRGAMDVWSLGCVVLEFATGRRPWSQLDNEWAIMFHIGMAQQHPPLPEPGQLSDLGIDFIRQCLIIDPYDRPSAMEMRQHPWIQNLVEQLDTQAEEEAAIAAATGDSGTGAATPCTASDLGPSSSSTPLSVGKATEWGVGGASANAKHGGGSTSTSGYQHSTDSAAGIAAMVATPGTRSINGFNLQRTRFGNVRNTGAPSESLSSCSKSFSRQSVSPGESNLDTPATGATSATSEADRASHIENLPPLGPAIFGALATNVEEPPDGEHEIANAEVNATELTVLSCAAEQG